MRRALTLLLACALLTGSAWPARAQIDAAQREEADAFFARLFARKDTVGGAVIVNQGGQRLYSYFHGRYGKGDTPVTEDTVYKVASVTKMITAIGVMQLVQEEKIGLDDPLADGTGAPILNPAFPDQPITLRQVMSHTSSLLPTANYTGVPAWSAKYFDDSAPGSHYTYANLNGGLLGSLIERVSGQSLNGYMAQHVFSPLGVNAAYASTLLPDGSQLSYSFNADGTVNTSSASYLRADRDYDDTCDPAAHYRAAVGSLYISVKGLETLGAMLAAGGEYQGVRVLLPGSVHLMQMDQARFAGSSVTGESPYGLNTYRYPLGGVTWYGHQGWWSGRLVDLFYEPISRTAVVLVMNGSSRTVGTVDREVAAQMEQTLAYISPWVEPLLQDLPLIDDGD
ncbi:MAG: beta-lactamase family protein [Clostridia bacterium]|nr:beta-lactamase family protein [Clostridia bacterium]